MCFDIQGTKVIFLRTVFTEYKCKSNDLKGHKFYCIYIVDCLGTFLIKKNNNAWFVAKNVFATGIETALKKSLVIEQFTGRKKKHSDIDTTSKHQKKKKNYFEVEIFSQIILFCWWNVIPTSSRFLGVLILKLLGAVCAFADLSGAKTFSKLSQVLGKYCMQTSIYLLLPCPYPFSHDKL